MSLNSHRRPIRRRVPSHPLNEPNSGGTTVKLITDGNGTWQQRIHGVRIILYLH